MLPRPTTLRLTQLESRLVLSGQTAAALAAQTPHLVPGDSTPAPVLVGTNAAGEAIYTLTVAPSRHRCGPGCGCPACRAATAAHTAAASQPATLAPPVAAPGAASALTTPTPTVETSPERPVAGHLASPFAGLAGADLSPAPKPDAIITPPGLPDRVSPPVAHDPLAADLSA